MLRYAITDRIRLADDEQDRRSALLHQAARLAAEGIDLIQLREKDLPDAVLAALARKLIAALHANSLDPACIPKLLINSRADIAVATRADGVHLTSAPGSLTPAQVRALYAAVNLPDPIISVSCHSLADVARVASCNPAAAATLILFGPIFEKVIGEKGIVKDRAVKNTPEKSVGERRISGGTGLDLLRAACTAAAPIPVLALGGIDTANTRDCIAAGAAGIAAIRLFLEA
jgi:thiamine-phosphate pyrophosphorylase